MRNLIPDAAELKLMPDAAKGAESVSTDLNSTAIWEAIRIRELTLMPVMEERLRSPLPSRWGINE